MTKTLQHKKPIPDFKNRQEMAAWFDTHDMTGYDFKPVDVTFDLEQPKEDTLVLRLNRGIKDKLAKVAKTKGLNVSSLARMWLMEKLQSSRP